MICSASSDLMRVTLLPVGDFRVQSGFQRVGHPFQPLFDGPAVERLQLRQEAPVTERATHLNRALLADNPLRRRPSPQFGKQLFTCRPRLRQSDQGGVVLRRR